MFKVAHIYHVYIFKLQLNNNNSFLNKYLSISYRNLKQQDSWTNGCRFHFFISGYKTTRKNKLKLKPTTKIQYINIYRLID